MALVPDTTTFSLQDVVDVLDIGVLPTGSITSVTESGLYAQFNTASTAGLVEGKQVVITGTTYYNGTYTVDSLTATSFETTAAYTNNDTGTWTRYGDLGSLDECFTVADDDLFDPMWEESQDRLSNFRNYGFELDFTTEDTDDQGGTYIEIHGTDNWIFLSSGASLRAYTFNETTYALTYEGNIAPANTTYRGIWCADSYSLVFAIKLITADSFYLASYSYDPYDSVPNITEKDSTDITDYQHLSRRGIHGDDTNQFIFLIREGVSYDYIYVYSYDSSGNLTDEDVWVDNSSRFYSIFFDSTSGYLFLGGTQGLSILSVDSNGDLTLEDTIQEFSQTVYDVYVESGLAYSLESSGVLRTYSWDGTPELTQACAYDTQLDVNATGSLALGISGSKDWIYATNAVDDEFHVARIRESDGTVISYGAGSLSQINLYQGIYIPYGTPEMIALTRGTLGLSTLTMD